MYDGYEDYCDDFDCDDFDDPEQLLSSTCENCGCQTFDWVDLEDHYKGEWITLCNECYIRLRSFYGSR